jgi:hypothetical protein
MARFSEDELVNFTKPPSDTEEAKLENAERMVKEALREDKTLQEMDTTVFGQGSYANDTNVRLNSDIDINVRYNSVFYFDLPQGKVRSDFGLNSPSTYTFSEYKKAVGNALVKKFGRSAVTPYDKCITISASPSRVETDVVPTWLYRRYSEDGSSVEGVKFIADSGSVIKNFPLQHIENGKEKNALTQKRFKRLTRIFRRIRYHMIDNHVPVNDHITSFLVECLVWNVPNRIFNDYHNWTNRLRNSLVWLYGNTDEDSKCKEWGEVSEYLYLFRPSRKWSREDVNNYIVQMWGYVGYD